MTDPDARLPRAQIVFPALVQVHFDGACEPPQGGGIASYGFSVEGEGLEHEEHGLAVRPWSAHATNNVAEYVAAIRALEWLAARGFRGQVMLMGDSQLVIRQMQGEYEVRAPHLRAYWEQLRRLSEGFSDVRFIWVPREENQRADALSKRAIASARRSAGRHRPTALPEVPREEEDLPGAPSSAR